MLEILLRPPGPVTVACSLNTSQAWRLSALRLVSSSAETTALGRCTSFIPLPGRWRWRLFGSPSADSLIHCHSADNQQINPEGTCTEGMQMYYSVMWVLSFSHENSHSFDTRRTKFTACGLHGNNYGKTQGEKMCFWFRQMLHWDYLITPIDGVFTTVITLQIAIVYNFFSTWGDNGWKALAGAATANMPRLKYVHTELT